MNISSDHRAVPHAPLDVLADVSCELAELGIHLAEGGPCLDDVPEAVRSAAVLLRDAGLVEPAATIERIADRIAAEIRPRSSRSGDLPPEACAALLRQTADILRAAAEQLPADRVAKSHFSLRKGSENLRALLARLKPDGAPAPNATLRELLAATLALSAELAPPTAEAARRHLDYLAAKAGAPLPVLLAGGAPLPSVNIVRDTVLNLASELASACSPSVTTRASWPPDATPLVSPAWQYLCHFHVPKCGGTSLNAWLDTLAGEEQRWRPELFTQFLMATLGLQTERLAVPVGHALPVNQLKLARVAFHLSHVIHSHRPLYRMAPPGSCVITVVREPAPRLLSQVADWRRLTAQDRAREPSVIAKALEAAASMPLRDFLRAHGRGALRYALDNGMTRLFASSRLGLTALIADDAEPLLDLALESLHNDFALVGLTEDLRAARNALAHMLGLPPVGDLPRLNATDSSRVLAEEAEEAAPEIEALTALDRRVYEHARRLFEARHASTARAWSDADFEATAAEAATARLRGLFQDGCIVHSVRGPLLGRGFYPRDGLEVGDCAVWSGPEPTLVLYFPVPPGLDLELLVWVRGYADPAQRGRLVVRADGRRLPHAFEPCPGWAERLVAPFRSSRPFVRLEIDVGATHATPEGDRRQRGLSFDAYGWRVARHDDSSH